MREGSSWFDGKFTTEHTKEGKEKDGRAWAHLVFLTRSSGLRPRLYAVAVFADSLSDFATDARSREVYLRRLLTLVAGDFLGTLAEVIG